MEEMYVLARNTVSMKLSPDDEMFPLYVVGLYCLLCKYHRYRNNVLIAFFNTDI